MATPSETITKFNIEQGQRKRAAQMLNYEVIKSGCWIWQGSTFTDGYGKCPRYGKTRRAHRVFYEELVGPIPDGLQVLHKCDTPLCVNPEHLWAGTCLENHQDMDRKGRRAPNPALVYPKRLKRGDDNHMRTPEHRARMSGDNNPMRKAEARAKISGSNHYMATLSNRVRLIGDNNHMKQEKHRQRLRDNHICKKKLTAEAALEIFNSIGHASELAKKFGVHVSQIYNVRRGTTWSNITKGVVI